MHDSMKSIPLPIEEAIILGSTLVEHRPGPSAVRGKGCALQMAALAIGREDLAYSEGTVWAGGPHYGELEEIFGVDTEVITGVWQWNDRGQRVDEIAHRISDLRSTNPELFSAKPQNEESRAGGPALKNS